MNEFENTTENTVSDAEPKQETQWENQPNESSEQSGVLLRRKVKSCYNRAGGAMLTQFGIAMAVMIVIEIIFSMTKTVSIMAANPEITQEELAQQLMNAISGTYLIIANAITYLIANLAAFFIFFAGAKKQLPAKIFNKSNIPLPQILLCILSVIGIQGVSVLVQALTMSLTNMSGISKEAAAAFSFSDDMLSNAVLVIYFVFVAAITEELLCRGLVMKLLSPVNKTFALIASSLIFGIMHGNFNQMFNGFLLGLVLGYAAMKSGTIAVPIICHMAANANAMVLSYFEYSKGESFETAEMIYMGIMAVIGITTLIYLIKRNGRINENTDGYGIEDKVVVTDEEEAKLKWKLLAKCPTIWIFAAIYLIMAITNLTAI